MVLWSCYYDTAGVETDEHILITGGVVASADRWARFEELWAEVLREYRVSQFHMKGFAHFKKEFGHGCWRQEPRRAAFLNALIAVMQQTLNKVIVLGVVLQDYKRLDAHYMMTEAIGGPYSMLQAVGVGWTTGWLARKKDIERDRVEHFIEYGDAGQKAFSEMAVKVAGFAPNIIRKTDPNTGLQRLPFQAADLIAYEHRVATQRAIVRDPSKRLRRSFEELKKRLPITARIAEITWLRKFCIEKKFAKRETV